MKRAIPRPPAKLDPDMRMFCDAVKENIEVVNGVRGGKLTVLPTTATLADVIAKVNEILGRLQ